MVTIDRKGKFCAPWRHEEVASVHVYPDGGWYDFGKDKRHGKDAFDLWCALNGYWNAVANKPDRKAAYRFLNPRSQGGATGARRAPASGAVDMGERGARDDDPFAGVWEEGEV